MSTARRLGAKRAFTNLANLASTASSTLNRAGSAAFDRQTARSDIVQLAQTITKEVAACSLACKPPIVGDKGWDAVDGTTRNLLAHGTKLLHAASGLGADVLSKELRWATQALLEAIQQFATAQAACMAIDSSTSQRKAALSATGMVWEMAERIEKSSADEREAVARSLQLMHGIIEDALHDVTDLLASRPDSSPSEDVLDDMDDFDEDDAPLSADEHSRASAAHMLLRLTRHLLIRLIACLQEPAALTLPSPDALGRVHELASSLNARFDDLAGDLYSPQSVDDVRLAAEKLASAAVGLSDVASQCFDPIDGSKMNGNLALEQAMARVDLSSSPSTVGNAVSPARWFAECSTQLVQAKDKVLRTC